LFAFFHVFFNQVADDQRSTRKIVLGIAQGENCQYGVGDHLAVLPSNRPELVQELLDLVSLREPVDVHYTLESLDPDSFAVPLSTEPFTIREAFTNLLDITSPPKPDLLGIFAHFEANPSNKTKLVELAKGDETYLTS